MCSVPLKPLLCTWKVWVWRTVSDHFQPHWFVVMCISLLNLRRCLQALSILDPDLCVCCMIWPCRGSGQNFNIKTKTKPLRNNRDPWLLILMAYHNHILCFPISTTSFGLNRFQTFSGHGPLRFQVWLLI